MYTACLLNLLQELRQYATVVNIHKDNWNVAESEIHLHIESQFGFLDKGIKVY